MKRFFTAMGLVAALTMTTACAYIPVGDAQKSVAIALKTYTDLYQPAVIAYGKLPVCPTTPVPDTTILCHDKLLFAKLAAADNAVVTSIDAALGNNPTGDKINAALTAIQEAQLLIGSSQLPK